MGTGGRVALRLVADFGGERRFRGRLPHHHARSCETEPDSFPVRSVKINVPVPFFRARLVQAAAVAQQLRDAFPFETAPQYLIRDRDGIYGREVRNCLRALNVEEVVIAPRSPWQNPCVERFFGSLRRECLNHFLVFNERQLQRIVSAYLSYYHQCRPHLSLANNAPELRAVEPAGSGAVVALPHLGGLHHRYARCA